MRIGLLSHPDPQVAGHNRWIRQHARALVRLGHEVVWFADPGEEPEDGVRLVPLESAKWTEGILGSSLRSSRARLRREEAARAALSRAHRELDVVEVPAMAGSGAILGVGIPIVARVLGVRGDAADEARADRRIARALDYLALRGASAFSCATRWLEERVVDAAGHRGPVAVIPPGFDPEIEPEDPPGAGTGVLACARTAAGRSVLVDLARFLRDERALDMAIDTEPGGESIANASVLVIADPFESAPDLFLDAMAAGKVIVAPLLGGTGEILRHEVDALLVQRRTCEDLSRALGRALASKARRAALSRSARRRLLDRFSPMRAAEGSVELYEWVRGRARHRISEAVGEPTMRVTHRNWFDVWWMLGDEPSRRPVLGEGFAEIPLDELSYARAVLSRTYWNGKRPFGPREANLLEDLEALLRKRVAASRRIGREPAPTANLALPPADHACLSNESSAAVLADECWRLRDGETLRNWLSGLARSRGFAERAIRSLALRRLSVDAARLDPCPDTFGVLKRIYRDSRCRAEVVAQDQEWIRRLGTGSRFEETVRRLGLHAPLLRRPVFSGSTPRRPLPSVAAEVTVVIPSFRHEAYVGAAIESVLSQTHESLRLLVVDDRSPDGTVAAARRHEDRRLEIRVNESNMGLGASLVNAIGRIETPYVAILNSDDVFHPDRLRRCLRVLEKRPDKRVVATGLSLMDGRGRLLTQENACALDIGTKAVDWIRWYTSVVERLAPGEEASFRALLRHNHLVTSSNLVCRTSFLRERAEDVRRLKYCLDWSLLLGAALEDSLAWLPDSLLGYRLHDSNTVWFAEQERPGYVMEVNSVIAAALRAYRARRNEDRVPDAAIAEEIAALLRDGAKRHGEADGWTLYMAEAMKDLAEDPARIRLEGLSEESGSGGTGYAVTEQARLDRHAAEAFEQRARELEAQISESRTRLEDLRRRVEDAAALRRRIDEEAKSAEEAWQRVSEGNRVLEEERRSLANARAEIERLRAEEERIREDLREKAHWLDVTNQNLAEKERLLEAAREDHERLRSELEDEKRRTRDLKEQVDEAASALKRTEDDLRETRGRLSETGKALEEERRMHALDLEEGLSLLLATRLAHEERLASLHESLEWRLGRLLLRKLHGRGPLKTAVRFSARTRTAIERAASRLGALSGRRRRALLVHEGPFPDERCGPPAALALELADRGIPALIACWGTGSPHWLTPSLLPAVRRRTVLRLDTSLQRSDAKWFARRFPDRVNAVREILGEDCGAHRVFTLARSALASGAGYLHAPGLDTVALETFAASVLLEAPFGVSLGGEDSLEGDLARTILPEASLVVVDTEERASRLKEIFRSALEEPVVLHPPLRAPVPPPGAADSFVCPGPFSDPMALLPIAEGCKVALDAGAQVRIEVSGAEYPTATNIEACERLRIRASQLGVGWAFEFRGRGSPREAEEALARARVVVVMARRGDGCASLPGSAVQALAAGRPVVFFGKPVPDLEDGESCLVASDAPSLGLAMERLAKDPALSSRIGARGRDVYESLLRPKGSCAVLASRLRGLLGFPPSNPAPAGRS
ncbi:MAG: hypothetical protein Fur0037_16990 [Planctomycetota bacterium]